MTPERIEEIKRYIKTLHNPELYSMNEFHNAADIMDERKVEWLVELLAALEESKQQIVMWKRKYEGSVQIGDANYDAEQKALTDLAEAQQTIARQREAFEKITKLTASNQTDLYWRGADAIEIAQKELGIRG